MSVTRLWSALAIDTCIARGVDQFFMAPGSRCTPLTLAVAQHPTSRVIQHFDERGLAFAALGYARATGKPGVFVCTSGTAVANAFPAVVEASIDNVPMLLLTADRPPELRHSGANQTIDQSNIFGKYSRWFCDLPCPTSDIHPDFVQSQIDYAIEQSEDGPVQVNCMFREPFDASDEPVDLSAFPLPQKTATQLPSETIEVPGGNTVIVVGGCRPSEAASARRLADALHIPIVSDICSGLRFISPDLPSLSELPTPNTIIHIGGRVVSKSWSQRRHDHRASIIHIASSTVRLDPAHNNVQRIVTNLNHIHDTVRLAKPCEPAFTQSWNDAEFRRRQAIATVLDHEQTRLSEPRVAAALGQHLKPGHGFFVGNSLPIRDVDSFCVWSEDKDITVGANRGASGIDGLIASGVGFASGLQRPTTLLLGDLSTLHDLNSLSLVKNSTVPLVVVVMNNHGGGIFDLLPVARQTKHFEKFFATPHGLSFSAAAELFQLEYIQPTGIVEFQYAFREAQTSHSSSVIEVVTDRAYNASLRKRIHAEIAK